MTASAVQTIGESGKSSSTVCGRGGARNLPHHLGRAFASALLFPRRSAVAAIRLYQATLSPDHGPLKALFPHGYCRHEPTCSAYGKDIISRRGLVMGGAMLLRRLVTCHPWATPTRMPR